MDSTEIIGRIGTHKDRPERLCLMRPDGTLSNWFRRDETRTEISESLADAGLLLRDDDSVVRL